MPLLKELPEVSSHNFFLLGAMFPNRKEEGRKSAIVSQFGRLQKLENESFSISVVF
jgi:hypothetical protein